MTLDPGPWTLDPGPLTLDPLVLSFFLSFLLSLSLSLCVSFSSKGSEEEKKKIAPIRAAGGKTWKDDTLADWPDDDFRLFVGDLGNEVTDELLAHSFQKYVP